MRPLLSSSIRRVMRASIDFDAGGAAWAGRSSLPAPGYELAAGAYEHTQRVRRRRKSGTINTPRPARKSRPKPPNQTRRASSPGDEPTAAIPIPSEAPPAAGPNRTSDGSGAAGAAELAASATWLAGTGSGEAALVTVKSVPPAGAETARGSTDPDAESTAPSATGPAVATESAAAL